MKKKAKLKINDEIQCNTLRLIGADGAQIGVVKLKEAKQTASQENLDLVEIVPAAKPPVCRIMDYGKHLFEEKKKKAEQRKKQKQVHVKEIKFRPVTEEGDYQVKLRNLRRFLTDGDKTKVSLRFRGREMSHSELGMQLMRRVEKDLEELGTVEQAPQMEGRQIIMVLAPHKKKR